MRRIAKPQPLEGRRPVLQHRRQPPHGEVRGRCGLGDVGEGHAAARRLQRADGQAAGHAHPQVPPVAREVPWQEAAAGKAGADVCVRGQAGWAVERRRLREVLGRGDHHEARVRADGDRRHVALRRLGQAQAGVEAAGDDVRPCPVRHQIQLDPRMRLQELQRQRRPDRQRLFGAVDAQGARGRVRLPARLDQRLLDLGYRRGEAVKPRRPPLRSGSSYGWCS